MKTNSIFSLCYDLITESKFGTWSYTPPKDVSKLFFDFYALVFSDRIPIGYNVTAKDLRIQDPDLQYIWNETAERLVETLRRHLLDVVAIAIASEANYIFEYLMDEDRNDLEKYRSYGLTKKIEQLCKRVSGSNLSEDISSELRGKKTLGIMENLGIPRDELITFSKKMFIKFKLGHRYGGKSWAAIANAWLLLNNAKDLQSKINFIDHIYDLQHNTGSVFSKIKEYFTDNEQCSWLPIALEYKLNLKNIYQLIPLATPELQRFLYAYIYDKWGIASDAFTAEQQKKIQASRSYRKFDDMLLSIVFEEPDFFKGIYNTLTVTDKIMIVNNLDFSMVSNKNFKNLELLLNDFIRNSLYKRLTKNQLEEIYQDKLSDLWLESNMLSSDNKKSLIQLVCSDSVLEYIVDTNRSTLRNLWYWIMEILPPFASRRLKQIAKLK